MHKTSCLDSRPASPKVPSSKQLPLGEVSDSAVPVLNSTSLSGDANNDDSNVQIQGVYLEYQEELCAAVIKKFDVSRSEAEDIVQTAFIRYTEASAAIESPRAFLYKTCSNICIDQMRRRQVQLNYARSVVDTGLGVVDEVSPERLLEGEQRLGVISRALWAMPHKRRQLLMMSRFDGLSYAEIARQVHLSETVVRKHIAKALAGCQQALQANCK